MPQLSLSWLGLGPLATSPWLLLLLVGASWLLARILAWTYAFYENCSRLRRFPQPPKTNWFWGHLDLIPPTEQGLKALTQLVATYPQAFKTWMGPTIPIITLCHPDAIRAVLNASGTIWNTWWWAPWHIQGLPIQSSEEGLLYTQVLASAFGDVRLWWAGPVRATVRIFHPTCIRPVLFAPGRHRTGCSSPTADGSVLPAAGPVT
ncbi:PREDICTED: phylloquinone omega-hydroxylase CYP4F11-like [Propithecus coquereli]|uniref:phylloquinone omega-hydroxylase CYP4F11-like n=1 Tax=Propithecus coquereli TaxID=379532 RepID=UPI00063F30AA|nr:PREDICTED: phylloquinone omega-hydroxylase CYP4F11-like [Propithecus coquereli]